MKKIVRFPAGSRELEASLKVVNILKQAGHIAFFVGGCTRDLLLGKVPEDYDVVTDAGVDLIKMLFDKVVDVGSKFGTVIVVMNGVGVQTSVFRGGVHKDLGETLKSDATLRDFTINAIFMDPYTGEILDPLRGARDVERKLIRSCSVPVETLEADPLRVLRAIRFAACLNFSIESELLKALEEKAHLLVVVAAERIRDELIRMFTSDNSCKALDLLDTTGALRVLMPEVAAMHGVPQPVQFHPEGDVYQHTRSMFCQLKEPDIVLALSVLLHDVGKPVCISYGDRIRFNRHDVEGARMAKEILERLKFPKSVVEDVVACVENHMRLKEAPHMRKSTLWRHFSRRTFQLELELFRLDCLNSHGDLSIWRFMKEKYEEYKSESSKAKPFLRGKDLLALGFEEGPLVGEVLRHLENLQIEGVIKSKEEAVEEARKFLPQDSGT